MSLLITLEQLKVRAEESKQGGTQNEFIDLAMRWIDSYISDLQIALKGKTEPDCFGGYRPYTPLHAHFRKRTPRRCDHGDE